jgi:hypothetical protein
VVQSHVPGQAVIALSSGEAEFYGLGKGASCSIFLRQFPVEFGVEAVSLEQRDSNAAQGIATRIGSGKLRHVAIRDLWVQEKIRANELDVQPAIWARCTLTGRDFSSCSSWQV